MNDDFHTRTLTEEPQPATLPVASLHQTPLAVPPPATTGSVPVTVVQRPVDRCAIASAICGMTAIVPVVSQIAGIVLGIVALVRIRRARREGIPTGGLGWAATGIVSSSLILICWLVIFAVLGLVMAILMKVGSALEPALSGLPAGG
jgi:hypothetical protein